MRSTAFTSAALALLPALAAAQPFEGCHARRYTAEHLAAQPAQVVSRISLWIGGEAGPGETAGELVVLLADQGRARDEGMGGREIVQPVVCADWGEGFACGVECDGGRARLTAGEGGALLLTTDRLIVGADCGEGGFDLVERLGAPVTYRLLPDAPEACG